MRIGHCQLVSTPGEFAHNLAKMELNLAQAHEDRVAILSFPECYLTGYQDTEEEVRKHAFAAYMKFHQQGRDFPIFERDGVKFGVIICADGGYIEPTRILALKGARIIFAPHYNYIRKEGLIGHFMQVRADHVARARENGVHFVRGNNVAFGKDAAFIHSDGVGYGDSYILDADGEILRRSRRHVEDYFFADIVPAPDDESWGVGRSRWSLREFGALVQAAAEGRD